MFPEPSSRRRLFKWILVSLAIACYAGNVKALNPNRAMSEYVRDRWEAQEGFPGGPVYAITQTADGYLWLGTENGLVRFDGLEFKLFNQTNSNVLPPGPVIDLITDGDGNLWIRPQTKKLLRYKDGQFYDVTPELDQSPMGITAMCRGINGAALFAVRTKGVYTYRAGRFSELISSDLLIISITQTGDGVVWMGSRDIGLIYVNEGRMSALTKELPDIKINSLLAVDREVWIGTDNGLVRWNGRETNNADLPDALKHTQITSLTRDSGSNLWVGAPKGLTRLNAGRASLLQDSGNGASEVNATFEDRERNLWIGTGRGLERLRDSPFITYSASQDPSAQSSGLVYFDEQGRKWLAPSEGGLYWQKDSKTSYVKSDGLDHDVVYSLTGNKDELWIGRQRGGLTRLRIKNGSVTSQTYTHADGLPQNSIYSVYQSRDGTVWVASVSGGVSRFNDGRFTTYTVGNGLPSNTVTSILEDADGTIWFATTNGLTSLSQGRLKIFGETDGLPSGRINCLFEDRDHALWIGTDSGVAIFRSGKLQVAREVPNTLQESVQGIAEDRGGTLWLATANHILRVNRDRLISGTVSEADVREFGLADGLRSVETLKRDRTVIEDRYGQIWFATYRGISVVDPSLITDYSVPALVHIETVIADGSPLDLQKPISILGARQRITFSYAGLSLSIPERVRFRYKLDPYDQHWSDPVTAREVPYTNLGPGFYTFRVMASNSSGIWNGLESTIQIEIQPFIWQTWWFRFLIAMAGGLTILFLYRLKLHRLTRQMDLRFEERLAERTRIAQDLHDTLLQGFLSASMQLHVAADQVPDDLPAKPLVNRVLELMREVIEEGRTTLKGLRLTSSAPDLAQSFSGIQDELASSERIDYRITVEGPTRQLHPVIRDEIYHIIREALVNAFRHARAKNIEVELEYGPKRMRVLVRDDGRGIDTQVLVSGREGHWGIPGMRERAEEIGAKLKLWSSEGAGTEVELSIPGQIAYELHSSRRGLSWLAKLYPFKSNSNGRREADK